MNDDLKRRGYRTDDKYMNKIFDEWPVEYDEALSAIATRMKDIIDEEILTELVSETENHIQSHIDKEEYNNIVTREEIYGPSPIAEAAKIFKNYFQMESIIRQAMPVQSPDIWADKHFYLEEYKRQMDVRNASFYMPIVNNPLPDTAYTDFGYRVPWNHIQEPPMSELPPPPEERIFEPEEAMNAAIGKELTEIKFTEDEELLLLHFQDGSILCFCHEQDCCENVYLEDDGRIRDAIGQKLVMAFVGITHDEGDYDSCTSTWYHLRFEKMDVTLRFMGESNGYYSEAVNILFTPGNNNV
jgi:hypothetical protein